MVVNSWSRYGFVRAPKDASLMLHGDLWFWVTATVESKVRLFGE